MKKNAKIYVAGHSGLVGSALIRQLKLMGYNNIVTRSHEELDLIDQRAVVDFFSAEKPEYVFLAAAKVGGIYANNTYPAEFIYSNLAIQTNVIHQAYLNGVRRLLFMGSSCIYPRECLQPIKEEYLLAGTLEPTNRPYALAKIAGIEMCWSYNRQYGTQYLAVMPTNLFGLGDSYNLENSHVIPAMIRKFHEAKIDNLPSVSIWGTGSPKREFLYSDDMAEACVYIMNLVDDDFKPLLASDSNDGLPPLLNLGSGNELSIIELARLIKEVVGFRGEILLDKTKPDGIKQKLLDTNRLTKLGWSGATTLREGLVKSYKDFQKYKIPN